LQPSDQTPRKVKGFEVFLLDSNSLCLRKNEGAYVLCKFYLVTLEQVKDFARLKNGTNKLIFEQKEQFTYEVSSVHPHTYDLIFQFDTYEGLPVLAITNKAKLPRLSKKTPDLCPSTLMLKQVFQGLLESFPLLEAEMAVSYISSWGGISGKITRSVIDEICRAEVRPSPGLSKTDDDYY